MADDTTPAAAPAPRPAPPLPSGFRPVETPAAPAPRPAPPLPSGFRPVESEARRLVEGDSFLSRTADRVAGAVDVATDIGEGILSGGVNFVQGIAELPAIGFDAAFDTNTARAVTDFFEPARDFVQPEGTAGRVAADLTTFGAAFIPLAGWLSRASQSARLAKAGKAAQRTVAGKGPLSSFMRSADNFGSSSTGQRLLSTRFGQYGTTALATGAFTALVSPDGRATLSDSFDAFPEVLKTEADTGLQGREEALRRVRNRLRQGAEDAIISGAFDTTLSALGAGARQLAQVPQVAAAANTFNSALAQSGAAVTRRFPKAVAVAQEYFTPSGGAVPRLFAETEDAKSVIRAAQSEAQAAADDYTSALNDVMKAVDLSTKNRLQSRQFYGEVNRYLEGASDTLPSITDATLRKKVTDSLDRMITVNNNHIDRLMFQMEQTAKNPALDETQRQRMAQEAFDVLKQTRSAQGTHLRRAFEIHTNPVKFYKNLDLTSPLAKKAQQEIAQNLAAMEGRDALDEAVQQRAKNIMFNSLGLGDLAVTKGVSEERLVKEALDRAIEANKGSGKLGSLIAKDRQEFVTDKSLFTPQEEALTKSPALRELLGEVANPVERFVRTTEDVTRAFVAEEFYKALPRLNLERNLMDGLADLNAGLRPAVISVPDLRAMTEEQYAEAMLPFSREAVQINADEARLMPGLDTAPRPTVDRLTKEQLVERYEQRLTKNFGYIKLGEADATDVFGGLYGAASGKYVSPETYRAITQPLRLQHGVLSEVLGTLSGLRNFTQKMSIVPNPAAQIRNIFGNVGFLAGNANLPTGANVTDLLYTFVANTKELDDAGLQRLARKLELSGVAESNLVLQALKDYQNAADDLTFSGKMNELLNSAEGVIPFMRAFEALYSNTDTFFKGASLLAEEGKLANALSRAKVGEYNPDLLQSFITNGLLVRPYSQTIRGELSPIELMATEVVKDTMPIYNRVVKAVRVLDAIPVVGNFTSFAAENIRNSIGTVMRGIREAGYEAGPVLRQRIGDQAANTLEQEIRAIGIQRLMGYTTMAYVVPKTLVKMSMQATNTSPEQMAALYEMNPDYLDGHDLVILENNREDGYIDYVDLSYVMPYAFMTDAAQAAIREFQEKGRADASTLSSATQGVWRGFQMFADPFAAETLFYERLRNVMPAEFLFGRGGVSATGAEIYGPNQSMADKALASFNHLMAGLTPNVATMLVEEQNGQLREGRLLRAYTGTPDRQGETTNPSKEIARLVTGFTPMRLNMRTDARYKGSEYLPLRTDSLTRALRGLKDAAATPESVVADWEAYLDELYRAQSSLYRSVEAMRTLGMNDSEIRYALVNQAGLGRAEAGGIIDGRFSPGIPSVETAANIRDQLNREGRTRLLEEIDFGQLNDMSAARKDEPLRTAPEQRPEVLGPGVQAPRVGNPFMNAPVAPRQAPAPAPVAPANPFMQAPVIPQLPANPFMQQGAAPLSPALLGETPAEQAANMAIAQSTGRA